MIKSLQISNYALIEHLEMSPSDKLNIITGETGAGKSIMLGAVGLLLGNRADTKVLWDDSRKCIVEGIFNISSYALESFFSANELEYDQECIIRREINPTGKSRAFINDTPVTLDLLKKLGIELMDIHSQHETLLLNAENYQRSLLDHFAQHHGLIKAYQSAYAAFIQVEKRYFDLLNQSQISSQEMDYKQFIYNELNEANLDNLDQNQLEEELNILEHSEEIKALLSRADHLYEGEEFSLSSLLQELQATIREVNRLSPHFNNIYERIESASIEIKDILNEVSIENGQIIHDPEKKQEVKQSLDNLYRLQQKHDVSDIISLIKLKENVAEELSGFENIDEQLAKADKEREKHLNQVKIHGKKLSNSRNKAAIEFSSEIGKIIRLIGIENGIVRLELEETQPTENGLDRINFLFSANKGIQPKELKDVASGGEFSRLIFAIKFLIADKTALPTIIFDEVDTGVSGEIAMKMMKMMKKMSVNHQVIAISHLPQFAAGGDAHYFVYKDHSSTKSISKIKRLENDQRIEAIAEMIGGSSPSDAAFENARELLAMVPNNGR